MDNKRERRRFSIVKKKHIQVLKVLKNYSGEDSPYWEYMDKQANLNGERSKGGLEEFNESSESNPDQLQDNETFWLPRYTNSQREKLEIIQQSLSKLSPLERKIIMLIYTENLDNQQIAFRLKKHINTVATTLNRAKEKIKKFYVVKTGLSGSI